MATINIQFPLLDDVDKNKYFKLTEITKDALASDLLLLLLTEKGERYYNPNYGTNLKKYIFEPKDNLTQSEVEREIKETVKTYIPELTIQQVRFFADSEDDQGNPVAENELIVLIDFTYNQGVFEDTGRLEITF
ncbi:MAG: GPW/gp25 family protein [bacterium]